MPEGLFPVDVEEIYSLTNWISYCLKRDPRQRSEQWDSESRRHDPLLAPQQLELDRWLLGQSFSPLVFLRGVRRVKGTLTLCK